MTKPIFIDLFAGAGGLSEGFVNAGFEAVAHVEVDAHACKTLQTRSCYHALQNKKQLDFYNDYLLGNIHHEKLQKLSGIKVDNVIHASIGEDNTEIFNYIDDLLKGRKVDVVIGGPPCQAYSIAGRVQDKNGMQNDYRNYLFESYVDLVAHYQPKVFVFENVGGMLSAKPNGLSIVDRITAAFSEIGYEITDNLRENALFNTSFYNVPQRRNRIIIFGVPKSNSSQDKINRFYATMKNKANTNAEVSREAFEGLPKLFPDTTNSKTASHKADSTNEVAIKNHEPRFHNERDIDIFRLLANDIRTGEKKYLSSKALIEVYKEKTGKDSKFHKYHVIQEDKPSNTIPAHLYKDGLRHIHPDPDQARSITVREAARLQTFPDDFEFLGSRGDQYKMVGNAVPPAFAKIIAETVYEILRS